MKGEAFRRLGGFKDSVIFSVLLGLALLFAWTAMSPCLKNGFINWDETEYITRNPRIRTLSPEGVKAIFTSSDLKMYSPLATLSYALNYRAAGLAPRAYHATDLVLHLLNTALVLLLARLLLADVWAAFFIALLFGIHPAHVESVAWAAERKDLLYSFFYLAALAAYALRFRGMKTYFLTLLLFLGALFSKPMAVTLPLALLLVDYLKDVTPGRRLWLEKLPFFFFSALFAFAAMPASGAALGLGWGRRLLLPFYNLGFYVYTLLWPFDLSAMYVFAPGGRPAYLLLAAAALAGIFLVWKYFRRDKEVVFGAAFFAVMLLPVLQFFPFGPVVSADRYTYLSSIGVFFIAAVCARRLWRRPLAPALRWAAAACAVAAVLTLAVAARLRCGVWKDGISLWSDTLRKQPAAGSALVNLCGAYVQAGRDAEAESCLAGAIVRYPGNDDNYYNLGYLYARKGEYGRAEEYFARTLRITPCHAPALNNLGNLSLLKGDAAGAERYYARAARCDSSYPAAASNLAKMAPSRKGKAAAPR